MLLRPIALVVMRCGMTWKEFSDLSKSVFVEVATEEFGIRGRPTNVSRVSILTGISRKEVKRQRDLLQAPHAVISSKTSDATRVLSGWHLDPLYLDDLGAPLQLSARGPVPSFETLFASYGGDTPEQTLIKELLAAGSVEKDGTGRLTARSRYHMPVAMSEGNIRFFGSNLFDHAHTLSNNVSGDGSQRRLEGFAVDDRIAATATAEFREFIDLRGQQFLEEVDGWLDQHRHATPDQNTETVRLGVGVYAIDGPLPKGTSS
ncbi:MAG: hypothetical protein BMS9Abin32_247 [Gammaproteobacteria bacterium]|nr:MAG: hypothetical protein BMS9Abin32_247 [Gammaproteobacteria bacterium]